ncbi:MAG: hypothetical protein M5U28_41645 [Sandaracinaceae bacterium]|nr:hypothetical protein [Sandaracinaceae bacterium]
MSSASTGPPARPAAPAPGTEGDGASCADLDRCAEVGCAECADAPAPGDGFSCGECPAGTVDGASGCAVPVCAGARLCAAAASADVLSRTLDVLPSGANLYFGQGVSTHRGFAIPIGAFPCCVFPGTATAGIALASERPIEWAPLATADPASYVLHPGLASQGSRLLLINPLDYASTVPVSLPSLAAEATLPSDVAGTSGAPPALLRLAGGSFAALVAQPLEPMRLRRLDAALRTIDEEVVASSEARFGALTPTCHGNALATWWTGAGTAAQPLDATGHRIGMVSSVASHAPDATHRPAVFDGRVVVTPGRDEILEIDADGVFVTRTPAPNALAAFGTDEGCSSWSERDRSTPPSSSSSARPGGC